MKLPEMTDEEMSRHIEKMFGPTWIERLGFPHEWKPTTIFHNLKRLIEWTPIIWKDADWDHLHIDIILQYKLKRMRECLVKSDHFSKKTCERFDRQIRTCELLLERIIQGDYRTLPEDAIWSKMSEKAKKTWFEEDDQLLKTDRALLYKLLYKHQPSWWN